MDRVNLREWLVDGPAGPEAWTFSEGGASTEARRGSDVFRMPGVRVIDSVDMLYRTTTGDFTFCADVAVEGDAFADAAGLLVRAGEFWLKACVERTKQGDWCLVTIVSCPSSDEAYGARVERAGGGLLVTRQGPRVAVFGRPDSAAPWRFMRTFSWTIDGDIRVGLFAQAPFSERVRATFGDVLWSSSPMSDRR